MPLSADSIHSKQYSVYASLIVKDIKGFYSEVGGRLNNHSVYGNNFTYSLSESYLYQNFKVFVNISSGYRAPSLYQLYSEYGNKDLSPETSRTLEAGLQYTKDKFSSRIVTFDRHIKDVFTFYTESGNVQQQVY